MDGDAVWIASGMYAIRYLRGKEVSFIFYFVQVQFRKIFLGITVNKSAWNQFILRYNIWISITRSKRTR